MVHVRCEGRSYDLEGQIGLTPRESPHLQGIPKMGMVCCEIVKTSRATFERSSNRTEKI